MTIRGVTGDMNTGKTYFCTFAEKIGSLCGISVGVISGDDIRRYILSYSTEEQDITIRHQLIQSIGSSISQDNSTIDRIALGDILFTDETAMQYYIRYVVPRMKEIIIQHIRKKTYDIMLVEWAALLEHNMQDIVNNNIILMRCNEVTQVARARDSDIPNKQLSTRYKYFRPITKKQEYCRHIIDTSEGLHNTDIQTLLSTLATHA